MERGQRERMTEVAGTSASSGVRTDSQGEGAGKQGGHGAPLGGHGFLLPLCLAKGGEQSKGEREIAEEGRDSGVHFVSSAHAHTQGEWGRDLSMMATWWQASVLVSHVQMLEASSKMLEKPTEPLFSHLSIS